MDSGLVRGLVFENFAQERRGAAAFRLFATSSGVPAATISPPLRAGFRADVHDVIGFRDDAEIVLDDDDGVAFIDEPVEDLSSYSTSAMCRPMVGSSRR